MELWTNQSCKVTRLCCFLPASNKIYSTVGKRPHIYIERAVQKEMTHRASTIFFLLNTLFILIHNTYIIITLHWSAVFSLFIICGIWVIYYHRLKHMYLVFSWMPTTKRPLLSAMDWKFSVIASNLHNQFKNPIISC